MDSVEVARRLIAQSDKPMAIEYTGLQNGEKLHQVLLRPTGAGSGPRPRASTRDASHPGPTGPGGPRQIRSAGQRNPVMTVTCNPK